MIMVRVPSVFGLVAVSRRWVVQVSCKRSTAEVECSPKCWLADIFRTVAGYRARSLVALVFDGSETFGSLAKVSELRTLRKLSAS